MSALAVSTPFPIYPDIDGKPLDNGSIYIGVAGLSAALNPINVYFDEALTQLAAQPIATRGGYPVNNGVRSALFVNSDYSIQVLNSKGTMVYESLQSTDVESSDQVTFLQAGANAVQRTVQSKLRDVVSVKDFGAVGDGVTDDRASIASAVTAANGKQISFPAGTYRIATAYAAPEGTRFLLEGGASFTVNQPTGASITYERYNTAGVAGSQMKIDNLYEQSQYPLKNEASIWSAGTYTYFGVSSEITNSTVAGQGNGTLTGGPVTNFFSFVNNNGANGDVAAILADAVARTTNGTVFGANFIARNDGGTSNTKLIGIEVDVQPAVGTTVSSSSAGIIANVFSIPTTAPMFLGGAVGGGTWGNGFVTSHITGAHFGVNLGDPVTSASFINTINGNFSEAAIVLGNNQKLKFSGTTSSHAFQYIDTSDNVRCVVPGSVWSFRDAADTSTLAAIESTGAFNAGLYKISGTQVVAARNTGWSAPTGVATKTTFDTSTVTTSQLAERVKALIDALTTHGLIGA